MNTSCKFKQNWNSYVLSDTYRGKLLNITNKRRVSGGSRTTPQLAASSVNIVGQQIWAWSILLEIGPVVNRLSWRFERFLQSTIDLRGKIQQMRKISSRLSRLDGPELRSTIPRHRRERRNHSTSNTKNSVGLIKQWQWLKLLKRFTPVLTKSKWCWWGTGHLIVETIGRAVHLH